MIWIITITYNDAAHLLRTLESVRHNKLLGQRYAVIDGGSIDETSTLLESYSDIIDFSLSESDRGIYDAMNKVVRVPAIHDDDLLIWINAGDELLPWPADIELRMNGYDCAFFGVAMCDECLPGKVPTIPRINLPYDERNFWPRSSYPHQGFFIRMCAFKRMKYDTTVGIQAESLLMSQAVLSLRFLVASELVARYYIGGISTHQRQVFVSWFKVMRRLHFSMLKVVGFNLRYVVVSLILCALPDRFACWLLMTRLRQMFKGGRDVT